YVLLDRNFDGLRANFVGVDDELVGLLATQHLIASGCRRIAHIAGVNTSTALGRERGYLRALAEGGIEVRPEYLIHTDHIDANADRTGENIMRDLLAMDARPDGVYCYNDPIALGAMRAVLDRGLRI